MKINKITVNKSEEYFLPIVWYGKETEINYDISLAKEGSSIKLLMLILGSKKSIANINIKITHDKPNTKSYVVVKGILNDQSSINFNGLVKIEKNSVLSNAWLAAHLLLLSDRARGRAIPGLEILENDIKAGHATTVGKVNDAEIFYLMTRGLTHEKARKIIIEGFLNGFLNDFPDGQIKQSALKNIRYAI